MGILSLLLLPPCYGPDCGVSALLLTALTIQHSSLESEILALYTYRWSLHLTTQRKESIDNFNYIAFSEN